MESKVREDVDYWISFFVNNTEAFNNVFKYFIHTNGQDSAQSRSKYQTLLENHQWPTGKQGLLRHQRQSTVIQTQRQ